MQEHIQMAYNHQLSSSGRDARNSLRAERIFQTCSSLMQWCTTNLLIALSANSHWIDFDEKKASRAAALILLSVNLKKIMFVCTGTAISIQPNFTICSLSNIAISLSFANCCGMVFMATKAGPATIPGLRITPPSIFLLAFRRAMNFLSPTTSEPSGAHNPLLRQKVRLSTFLKISAGSAFKAARPWNVRAPSTCTWIPSAFAILQHSQNYQIGGTSPQKVGNSSTTTAVFGDWLSLFFLITFFKCAGVMYPSGQSSGRVIALEIIPHDPFSYLMTCAFSLRMTSSPGLVAVSMQT